MDVLGLLEEFCFFRCQVDGRAILLAQVFAELAEVPLEAFFIAVDVNVVLVVFLIILVILIVVHVLRILHIFVVELAVSLSLLLALFTSLLVSQIELVFALGDDSSLLVELLLLELALFLLEVGLKLLKLLLVVTLELGLLGDPLVVEISLAALDISKRVRSLIAAIGQEVADLLLIVLETEVAFVESLSLGLRYAA